MPTFLSDEVKDLLQCILQPDPTLRFTIEDIRAHPWYNKVLPTEKHGVIVGKDVITENQNILEILVRDYQIDPERCKQDV
jgi:serine/threonine protein kinase